MACYEIVTLLQSYYINFVTFETRRRFSVNILVVKHALIAAAVIAMSVFALGQEVTPGTYDCKMTVDGRERAYRVRISKSYAPGKKMPLVIMLHGGGGNGRQLDGLNRLGDLAEKRGFIVVYPDAFEKHWNDGRGIEKYKAMKENVDDVKFISRLIDELAAKTGIDTKRVYATGISNGAFMANRLGAELSDKIAAIAPVAATMSNVVAKSAKPSRPVPVIYFHGTDDKFAYFDGGDIVSGKGTSLSADAVVKWWVEKNACAKDAKSEDVPDEADDGTKTTKYAYESDKAPVVFYKIDGGGHTWPGGLQYLPEKIVGKVARDFNANELIWEFFSKYSLP